ncbi:uncharacterized protein LOC124267591 isoform X2 [Haliotis rubra]|uniref:uncharacterized protein LOC124267591 isoform X2 n=1 Tax=Haliotis rubra TaxID=36100 RepID=UPI001EE61394|nr:uncharacterized protein LOC124267591 isoform X2 [Haliotis rubra]
MPGWMGPRTVTLIMLMTVGLRVVAGEVWELNTTRLSPYLMRIDCSLNKGFQPDDKIRIVQPPNNGTRTTCRFPSKCILNDRNDSVFYGQRNTTLSIIFTPENSGLYSCIYNEDHGAIASGWVTVQEPTDTTTPPRDPSTAVGLDTPSTAEHVTEATTNLTGDSSTDEKAFITSSTETPAAARGFSQSEPGIWVTCLGLIVYQCA